MKRLDFKKAGMQVIATGAGAVAGKVLNKPLSNMNPKLRGFMKIVAGALLPSLSKGDFMQGFGHGLVAIGAAEIVTEFMPNLAGIGESDTVMTDVGFVEQSDTVSGDEMYESRVYGDDDGVFGSDTVTSI